MKDAYIWRESVYKNGFKCNRCGTRLFDNGEPTDALALVKGTERCVCTNCGEYVARYKEGVLPDFYEAEVALSNGHIADLLEQINKKEQKLKLQAKLMSEETLSIRQMKDRLETAEALRRKAMEALELERVAHQNDNIKYSKQILSLEHRLEEMEEKMFETMTKYAIHE